MKFFGNKKVPAGPTIWRRDFVLLLIVNGVAYFSFQILMPLLPVYGVGFASDEAQLGALAASISVAALLIRPFSGILADRYNRKIIVLVTQFGTAAVIICFILAFSIQGLIAARFVHGLLFGIGSTAVTVSAIHTIPEEKLGQGIGMLSITGIGSQAVAPALGIAISGSFGFDSLFVFTAVVAALAVFPALAARKGQETAAGGSRVSLKSIFAPEGLTVAGITLVFTMATSTVTNFLVLFGDGRDIANVGLYFTIYASVLIATRLLGSKLTDKYPFQNIVGISAALCTAGLALIASADSFVSLAIAAVIIGMGYGAAMPALQTEIVRRLPQERRGAASAMFYLAMDTAYVVGPLGMGFIAKAASFGAGFYALCIPMAAAVPLVFVIARSPRTRRDNSI